MMADKSEAVEPTSDENVVSNETEMETEQSDKPVEEQSVQETKNTESKDDTQFVKPTIQFKMPGKAPLSSPITNLDKNNKKTESKSTENETKTPPQPKAKASKASPAEKLQQAQVTFPYKEPSWSGMPEDGYSFEILKNGAIIENLELKAKPFYVFGRLPSCDVTMEHPSLSRYHAVVQFCKNPEGSVSESGWYLYDLDSTHGTWLNKNKVKSNVYHRIRVGHVVKFGGSSRLHILQGPEADQEEESELSITEIKQQREKQKREAEVLRVAEAEQTERVRQQMTGDDGCSWGMGDDAEEEIEEGETISLKPENEDLYINDPKKALNGFYEREGCDLPEYIITDGAPGKYKCRVDLPVDGQNGEPLIAEVMISGKKKEAVIACALEACRLLDRHQLLRQAKHESRKKKAKNWEADDFYDSDEDTFLDRTGTIEKKRTKRMIQAGKVEDKGDSYNTLLEKHKAVISEMEEIEAKLEQAKAEAAAFGGEDVDALDAYMSAIKAGVMDTKTKMSLKRRLIVLRTEEMRCRKLVNIAKPAALPELKQPVLQKKVSTLPADKMKGLTGHKPVKKTQPKVTSRVPVIGQTGEEMEEEEEEEESEEESETSTKSDKTKNIPKTSTQNSNSVKNEKQSDISDKVKSKSAVNTLSSVLEQLQNEIPDSEQDEIPNSEDKSKIKGPVKPSKKDRKGKKRISDDDINIENKKKKNINNMEADSTDPDYASWLPPVGQSGDGKTHLNDKFGY